MAIEMNKDFTFRAYREYISIAKNEYPFCSFDECNDKPVFVVWRHDIDMCIRHAAILASIEYEERVKATYFVWLHSWYYNYFSKETIEILYGILNKGHNIGLHFDCEYYTDLSIDNFGDCIAYEAEILGKALQTSINVFSFHNTTKKLLEINKSEIIGGLINTYSEYFFGQCKYISDSNGVWWIDELKNVLNAELYPKLHVLIHPVWWSENPIPPLDRVFNSIDYNNIQYKTSYEERRKIILREKNLADMRDNVKNYG